MPYLTVAYCPEEDRWFIGPQSRDELHPHFCKGFTHTAVAAGAGAEAEGRRRVRQALARHNKTAVAKLREPKEAV